MRARQFDNHQSTNPALLLAMMIFALLSVRDAWAGANALSAEDRERCQEIVSQTLRSPGRDAAPPELFERLVSFCTTAQSLPNCRSQEGLPIGHFDAAVRTGADAQKGPRRILVLGLIHGDEPMAGHLSLSWAERLKGIEHRNKWRVVPLLNPDGLKRNSRLNSRGVDLNRNFPTKDWSRAALSWWRTTTGSDPRRFPGEAGGSEAETRCAIAHIKDFRPDFIVSVHTPYKVLDFDGPKVQFPRYKDLPWKALGNFPGSLGRYMWKDHQIPVLTVELGESMVDQDQLQDVIGTLAIETSRRLGRPAPGLFDLLLVFISQ